MMFAETTTEEMKICGRLIVFFISDHVKNSLPLNLCLLLMSDMWFSGRVSILEDAALDSFRSQISQQAAYKDGDPKMKLTAHDIYKELRLRGYDYGKTFQGILESNNEGISDACCYWNFFFSHSLICLLAIVMLIPGDSGKLHWTGNWVTFLDTLLQMVVVGLSGRSLRLPTRIRSVCVDPVVHLEKVSKYIDGQQGVCLFCVILFNINFQPFCICTWIYTFNSVLFIQCQFTTKAISRQ